ncbi:hypothetical protein ACR777_00955 [Sphingobacterium spiritivorum]|uniref:hypothetical protein n=1 Tax=Sphingobacterium spiritivorum TaxID=258 RepID=UPI003DA21FDB
MNIFPVFDQNTRQVAFGHYTFARSGCGNPDAIGHKPILKKNIPAKNRALRLWNFQSEADRRIRIPDWLLQPEYSYPNIPEKATDSLFSLYRFLIQEAYPVASGDVRTLHFCCNRIINVLIRQTKQYKDTQYTISATSFFLGFSDFTENMLRNNCKKTASENKLISHSSKIFRKGKTIFGIVFGDQPNLYRQKNKATSISEISIDINLRKTTIYYEIQMSGDDCSEFITIFNIKKFGIQSANTHSLYDKELSAKSQTLGSCALI